MSSEEQTNRHLPRQLTANDTPISSTPPMGDDLAGEKGVAPDFTTHPPDAFPVVGELPVPNVNPLTAHVGAPPYPGMTVVSPVHSPPILCIV